VGPTAQPADRPDVIVVGGGITGSEAAWRLARRGVATLLVTTSLDTIATLPGDGWSFEPPPGGVLAAVADEARSASGWSARALHRGVKRDLERERALHVWQSTVVDLRFDHAGRVDGVVTWEGVERAAPRVALCLGTFLGARLSVGDTIERAGRLSELADDALFERLEALGLRFVVREVGVDGDALSPGYRVTFHALSDDETDDQGRVRRLPGLYAFGLCAGGPSDLTASAAAGRRAARALDPSAG
jgi:tRNA U34 5-carboxymethylaminomethyl modifying enzyme MnmG/GidA